ncbi:MAG: PHP domain-containing protein [Chloroflexi bacterium]|nr:PHP domain-containing protein [Chloroflexota bacterium]
MTLRADLHVHSTASDGRLTPEAVVSRAVEAGVSVLSLTDHDSMEGIGAAVAAARRHNGLLVLPGVEINSDVPGSEVHMLGYCMDVGDPVLGQELANLRENRVERGNKMVVRLAELGVRIDWERVQELAGDGAIGRPHVAQAIVEAGYVRTLAEAFDRYIGRNAPAYVEREKITPEKAVRLIIEAGGFAVLAHPHSFGPDRAEEIVAPLVAIGLAGIEAFYDGFGPGEVAWLVGLADRHNLLLSGGSDFHGFGGDHETPLGQTEIPSERFETFLARARKHRPELFAEWTLTFT